MVDYNTCPVCYSRISTSRLRGADGVDENGDPVPFWTDDPILTHLGLAGSEFKGKTPIRWLYIKELQDYYNEVEEDMGLEQTNFTEVSGGIPVRRIHIIELRVAVEKILETLGISLADHFKYDRYGNDTGSTQVDWSDVDRTDSYPSILKEKPIRAIYIEELRRLIYKITGSFGILSVIDQTNTEELYTYLFSSNVLVDENQFNWDSSVGFNIFLKASDDQYLWTYRGGTSFGTSTIVRYSWYTNKRQYIDLSNFGLIYLKEMFSDGVYLWLVTEENNTFNIGRLHIESMQFEPIGILEQPTVEPSYEQFQIVSVDKIYIYTMQTYKGITGTDANSHQRMEKVVRPIIQTPVLDKDLSSPPANPVKGDRYLVISGDLGTDWADHDNEIAEYSGVLWNFFIPSSDWVVKVNDEGEYYIFISNWFIWDRKLRVESFVNVPISYNKTTTDTFPQSGRYTYDSSGQKRYWYFPQAKWSPILPNGFIYCEIWGVQNCIKGGEPLIPFTVDYENWEALGSDDKYIYIRRKITRDYWDYCNKASFDVGGGYIRSYWSFDWCKVEEAVHDVIKLSKEDFTIESYNEVVNIIGDGRDFLCIGEDYFTTLHVDQQIRDTVVDRNNLYFLCYDRGNVDKREDSVIICPFPTCAEIHSIRVVNIPYPYKTCPEWYKYVEGVGYVKKWNTQSGYPELPASTVMPKGFLKIYGKAGNLLKIFDQQIGQFDFDKYEEIYDTKYLGLLSFSTHLFSGKQKWFIVNLPEYLQGG